LTATCQTGKLISKRGNKKCNGLSLVSVSPQGVGTESTTTCSLPHLAISSYSVRLPFEVAFDCSGFQFAFWPRIELCSLRFLVAYLLENSGIMSEFGSGQFLPNIFQFIIHWYSQISIMYSLKNWYRRKVTAKIRGWSCENENIFSNSDRFWAILWLSEFCTPSKKMQADACGM